MAWTEQQKRRKRQEVLDWWSRDVLARPEDYPPLRVRRCKAGLTQAELSRKALVSVGVIVRYESGGKINRNNERRLEEVLT